MKLSTDGIVLAADAAVDLQTHTVLSDGTWTPEGLIDHLRAESFGLAAITDHDRIDTAADIQRLAAEKGQPLLVATEMTTRWDGGHTDVLCFGFDPSNPLIRDLGEDVQRRQRENTAETADKMRRAGFPLDEQAVAEIIKRPAATQPHAVAKLAADHGYSRPGESPLAMVLNMGCDFEGNDIAVVVDAVHRSGGVCLIAHPGRGTVFTLYTPDLLDRLRREVPIDGIESNYPLHTPEQTAVFREYAQKHGLLTSAGSDSHGLNKQLPIKYPAALSRALLERLGITVQ